MNGLLLEHIVLDFCTFISMFWQHSCHRWKNYISSFILIYDL